MKRVGITGQPGFIGSHLYHTLGLYPDEFERVPFEDAYFEDEEALRRFVSRCDVIVHLAAVNRHHDSDTIYRTNVRLVEQLTAACDAEGASPHIIFSSSIQEERENPYGRSKRKGRQMLISWSESRGARFTGLVIPNVYGPFGRPNYNSVVATFAYQLSHGEEPTIEQDGELRLIYVAELVDYILAEIRREGESIADLRIRHSARLRVSQILEKFEYFRTLYLEGGVFPDLSEPLDRNLFHVFLCSMDHRAYFPVLLDAKVDERGSFVETVKSRGMGQFSFSTTRPGISRGNHYHTRKAERFIVIQGKARVDLRRVGTDRVLSFFLDGERPSYVDMPIWYTHTITNIGEDELYTLFWISEFFDPDDPDTYYEEV